MAANDFEGFIVALELHEDEPYVIFNSGEISRMSSLFKMKTRRRVLDQRPIQIVGSTVSFERNGALHVITTVRCMILNLAQQRGRLV